MRASDHIVMLGDCCPGKADQNAPCKRFGDGSGKNGTCTPCKAGYNCKSPQTYEPTHLVALLVTPARPILTSSPTAPTGCGDRLGSSERHLAGLAGARSNLAVLGPMRASAAAVRALRDSLSRELRDA
jgi:hypothetical protein